jgi:hypothetical protein
MNGTLYIKLEGIKERHTRQENIYIVCLVHELNMQQLS